MQDIQKVMVDPITKKLIGFMDHQNFELKDRIFLKNLYDKQETIFNNFEVGWVINNHRILNSLVKSPVGKKIFLEFCRGANNVYAVTRKLKVSRMTTYKWTKRFLFNGLLVVYTSFNTGNEKLLRMNFEKYPNLIILLRQLILEANSLG